MARSGTARRPRSSFGNLRRLPSGRYQVRYTDPDGRLRSAPTTFDTKGDAETFLASVRTDIARDTWTPAPSRRSKPLTFNSYADSWLQAKASDSQRKPLAPRTREHYRQLLDRFLLPTFGDLPLRAITENHVAEWYSITAKDRPTTKAHAYTLLSSILGAAASRAGGAPPLIPFNPAAIRGAGTADRGKPVEPASLEEIATIAASMPDRYRAMVLLAAWTGLRFGELTELRRGDVDTKVGILKVRRAVVRVDCTTMVGKPKSAAGIRDVAIPPHLLPVIREHLLQHAEGGRDGLLFPAASGGHLAPSTLYKSFYKARQAAGRPDLRWHDLRHTAATLAAQTGATMAELMSRLGHSTQQAAIRYQHAAKGRDKSIAEALSKLAEAK